MKTLVVYFSLTGSTEFVAKIISEQLNADLCEVVDKKHKNGKLIYIKGGAASFREKLTKIEESLARKHYTETRREHSVTKLKPTNRLASARTCSDLA